MSTTMDWMEKIKEAKAPAWLLALAVMAGPVIGALWADYKDFRGKQIEASISTVNASREADQKLNDILVKFAKLALGEGSISADDRSELDRLIFEVNQKAADVSVTYPAIREDYEKYSDALIGLRRASEILKGPKSGKEFVKAVADYSVAREQFRNASQSVSSAWWRTFLPTI